MVCSLKIVVIFFASIIFIRLAMIFTKPGSVLHITRKNQIKTIYKADQTVNKRHVILL
ncbi:hypothetical protein ABIB62_002890 [Mucilaginibacter sp. UYP25]